MPLSIYWRQVVDVTAVLTPSETEQGKEQRFLWFELHIFSMVVFHETCNSRRYPQSMYFLKNLGLFILVQNIF